MEVAELNMLSRWPDVLWHLDQPHGDASFMPTLRVSELAARHVKVVLTGDGGDELFAGYEKYDEFFARAGVDALGVIARRHGYRVVSVPVRGCLHLKTACTALPDETLLLNPAWLDMEALRGFASVPVPVTEPWAANVVLVGENVCAAAAHGRTVEMIRERGFVVHTTELSEFAKAEGDVTCLSLLFSAKES